MLQTQNNIKEIYLLHGVLWKFDHNFIANFFQIHLRVKSMRKHLEKKLYFILHITKCIYSVELLKF